MADQECGSLASDEMTQQFMGDVVVNATVQGSQNRIINGRNVDFAIPWVVRLAIRKKDNHGRESLCTGSVLNHLLIMTAAHCLCTSQGRCMDDFSPGILTDLFGQNRVFIFVGGPRQDDMIRHRAKSAWIHPNYNGTGAYDIAIIRLYVSITFNEKVKPICLPNTVNAHSIDQVNSTVFTAGWGLRYVQERKENAVDTDNPRSSCMTNEVGPVTFAQCRGGWINCNRIDLPPIDPKCITFAFGAFKRKGKDVSNGSSIIRIIGDLNLDCYSKPIGEYGWCHVVTGGWGYCSRSCMLSENPFNELEFVTLQIVSTQKCDTSIKEDVELCVGGIAPIAWVATYRAKMAGITTENYTFILEERRQDPRFPEPIIGFKDSCSGDSGSPLWTFENGRRAIVVGLTSRGAAVCGEVDSPAIYTRISALLPWIEATMLQANDAAASVCSTTSSIILIFVVVTTRLNYYYYPAH